MMNRIQIAAIAAVAAFGVRAKTIDLNGEWTLSKNGGTAVTVRVPHDWSIGEPFDETKDEASGMLPWQGMGRYSRRIALTKEDVETLRSGGEAYLEFDGVMARPAVSVNGTGVGGTTYGYLSFSRRIGLLLKEGENTIDVDVNTYPHSTRWYPGGGIYRDVRLRILPKGHVVPGSVCIRTPLVTKELASVVVTWRHDDGSEGRKEFGVDNPRLWDVDSPHLYTVEVDGETYRYGIRTIEWTGDDGFHLNGRRLQIKGACLHADLGLLGMAFNKDAARRQLRIMRDMGVNAIRTSHNCPDPKFLDLCDEMGFVVWDECFDKWDSTASWDPQSGDIAEYLSMNLRAFVRRDRNHPCVIAWSVGNEIPGEKSGYFTGVERRRVRGLREAVRSEDDTRPVGIVACEPETCEALQDLDVVGWNYARHYLRMHELYPSMPMVYSETGSSLSDYGFYGAGRPAAGKTAFDTAACRTDGYDFNAADYGDIADVEFFRVETDRYLAGEFVWTGIDYLGEPVPWVKSREGGKAPIGSVARSSAFGAVDLTGFPKDRFWLYRSHWNTEAETVHILPHWNWEGRATNVTVMVYTSGEEAELFLNGRSLGRRAKEAVDDYSPGWAGWTVNDPAYYRICRRYRLIWENVAWEPGELKAVAYRGGERIGEEAVRTAGDAVEVRATLDPYSGENDEILFYRLAAVDAAGTVCPLESGEVEVSVSGAGEFVAAGNGNPHDRTGFASARQKLFFGRAMVAVRRTGPGEISVKAKGGTSQGSPSLRDGHIRVGQNAVRCVSPDGRNALEFTLSANGEPTYSFSCRGRRVIEPSTLGIDIKALGKDAFEGRTPGELRKGFTLSGVERASADETWEPVWGEESAIRDRHNEILVKLVQEATGRRMNIRFRVFDDGLGFRYEFPPEGEGQTLSHFTIVEERTRFNLPCDATAWWIPADYDTQEYRYTKSRVSEIPSLFKSAPDANLSSTLSEVPAVQTALMLKYDDGLLVNLHEAACVDYATMHLRIDAAGFESLLTPDATGAKGWLQTPCRSPWRTVIVGEKGADILASRITLNLNEPCAIADTSWIHPVKYVGVWWTMITGAKTWAYMPDPSMHAANTSNVMRHIDFAAAHGFDEVLVEGWNTGFEDWFGKEKDAVFDFTTPYPDFDLEGLNKHAREKGVKLMMYHETSASMRNYERRLDAAYALMNRLGYDTVKAGYVGNILPHGEHHYSQWSNNHYLHCIREAAKRRIMVNQHEAVRPTGLCRTWPNLIGNESARGTEYESFGGNNADHTTILPFTRLVGGPMDYTPGIFETDLSKICSWKKQRTSTTLAGQLALYVTLFSPLQMAADVPESYETRLDALQFIKDVPCDWDESRYIEAEIGDYVTVVRKAKGRDEWYLGMKTDEHSHETEIPLDFLTPGKDYEATIYADAPESVYRTETADRYIIERRRVNAAQTLRLSAAPGGGAAVSFK